jgi:hypothetical protein
MLPPHTQRDFVCKSLERCKAIQISRGLEKILIYDVSSLVQQSIPRKKPLGKEEINKRTPMAELKSKSEKIYYGFDLVSSPQPGDIIGSFILNKENDVDTKRHDIDICVENSINNSCQTNKRAQYHEGRITDINDGIVLSRISASLTEFAQYLFRCWTNFVIDYSFGLIPETLADKTFKLFVRNMIKCSTIYCKSGDSTKAAKYYECLCVDKFDRKLQAGRALLYFDESMSLSEKLYLLMFASAIFLKVNPSHDIRDAAAYYREKCSIVYSYCSDHVKHLLQRFRNVFKRLGPMFRSIASATRTRCVNGSNRFVQVIRKSTTKSVGNEKSKLKQTIKG